MVPLAIASSSATSPTRGCGWRPRLRCEGGCRGIATAWQAAVECHLYGPSWAILGGSAGPGDGVQGGPWGAAAPRRAISAVNLPASERVKAGGRRAIHAEPYWYSVLLCPGVRVLLLAVFLGLAPAAPAVAGTTTLVSVGMNGEVVPGYDPFISADGRYIAFSAEAADLVPGDTNSHSDAFVRDMVAGTTERISLSSTGQQLDLDSNAQALSADGRYVAVTFRQRGCAVRGIERGPDVRVRSAGRIRRAGEREHGRRARKRRNDLGRS